MSQGNAEVAKPWKPGPLTDVERADLAAVAEAMGAVVARLDKIRDAGAWRFGPRHEINIAYFHCASAINRIERALLEAKQAEAKESGGQANEAKV